MYRVAVLIDGGFFLKRVRTVYPDIDGHDPEVVVQRIRALIHNHLVSINKDQCLQSEWALLYRSFFYDARPYLQQAKYPVSSDPLNYARTPEAIFRQALFEQLRGTPNMAVRLGEVRKDPDRSWTLKAKSQNELLAGTKNVSDLGDDDFLPALRQKGVDMRIGVDIATLSLKNLVNTIVLVTGDSDFVPAAKLARREGVRIILDPLWQKVDAGLFEHIDRVHSGAPRPRGKSVATGETKPDQKDFTN